jgi:hypothetical protein
VAPNPSLALDHDRLAISSAQLQRFAPTTFASVELAAVDGSVIEHVDASVYRRAPTDLAAPPPPQVTPIATALRAGARELGLAFLEQNWKRKAKECIQKALHLNPKESRYKDALDLFQPETGVD